MEQVERVLGLFESLIEKKQMYTITGAADWPILAFCLGFLVLLIAAMWKDLRGGIQDNKSDNERDIDNLWKGLRDCKNDCCITPRNRDA